MQKIKWLATIFGKVLPCQRDLIFLHKRANDQFIVSKAVYLVGVFTVFFHDCITPKFTTIWMIPSVCIADSPDS